MKKTICVLLSLIIGIVSVTVFSQELERFDLEVLREKADSILNQPNISARKDIDAVFELADRLLKDGSKDSEHYLVQGLMHFPWDLEHQMVYAEFLAEEGNPVQAREKAELVLQFGETDDLIERARNLLGNDPLPTFDKMISLPGSDHCVVLVPLKKPDKWLLLKIQGHLSVVLGIPVQIQTTEMEYPPFGRDRYGALLKQIRAELKDEIDAPHAVKALDVLGITQANLDDDAELLRFLKTLMESAGSEAIAGFDASLEQLRGKDPQWDADQLLATMCLAVSPYRRKNVAYLGITPVDIYAKDYNFLFGWMNYRGGVISYRRFTADFNGETPNQNRLVKRTIKQCLSSIGHIYGLERCTNPTCARAYPNSLSEHDAKEEALCSQCVRGFKNAFEQSARGNGIPTPQP